MKKIFTFVYLLVSPILIFCQDLDYTKGVIQQLTSPGFKGRGYVEGGDKIAAEFISAEYEKIGLKSFARGYYQQFKVDVNTFPGKIRIKIGQTELEPGIEYLIDPLSSSIDGVYLAYVVKKEDLLIDKNVREIIQKSANTFLVIDERSYSSDNKEEKVKLNDLINFLKYSPQVPSVGTIILTKDKLSWSVAQVQAKKPSFIVNKEISINNSDKIEVKVDAKLIKNYKTQNVIGYIEGNEEPDSFIVLTAHYDHLGKMGEDLYFPGANDNSSGVAMLLNLAKYFKANPLKYSVAFIALSSEELGILGAKYYSENPLFSLAKIKFLVNFDLAGTGDDGIKVVNASVYKNQFEVLKNLNEKGNYLKSVQSRGAACNSDHCMFYQKGVPCFYIYTLGGIQAYHDVYDKYETLPLTEFEDYAKLMIEFFEGF